MFTFDFYTYLLNTTKFKLYNKHFQLQVSSKIFPCVCLCVGRLTIETFLVLYTILSKEKKSREGEESGLHSEEMLNWKCL